MTLHPRSLSSIPEMTATVARTSFPKGNPYMKMRDELGVLYLDTDFITLFRSALLDLWWKMYRKAQSFGDEIAEILTLRHISYINHRIARRAHFT